MGYLFIFSISKSLQIFPVLEVKPDCYLIVTPPHPPQLEWFSHQPPPIPNPNGVDGTKHKEELLSYNDVDNDNDNDKTQAWLLLYNDVDDAEDVSCCKDTVI